MKTAQQINITTHTLLSSSIISRGLKMKSQLAFAVCLSLVVVFLMDSITHAGVISDPTAIPGSQLWLDGNDVDGDGVAEGGGENFLPGGTATWTDKSSAGTNHATQATANNQPSYVSSGLNSQGIVRFDGGSDGFADSLAMPDFASGFGSATGFLVFVPSGNSVTPASGRNGSAWNFGTQGNSNHFGGSNPQFYDDFGIGTRPLIQNAATTGSAAVYTALATGTQFVPYYNAVGADAGGFPLAAATSFTTTPTLGFSVNAFNGDLAEVIIYNRVLSDGSSDPYDNELNDVWFYLQEKWALGLGLEATPVPVVPEPSSALLLGLGLLGLAKVRRRRNK